MLSDIRTATIVLFSDIIYQNITAALHFALFLPIIFYESDGIIFISGLVEHIHQSWADIGSLGIKRESL